MDSLLSIVQMPAGVPSATLAIGRAGAVNAALLAAAIVALEDEGVRDRLKRFRATQTRERPGAPRSRRRVAARARRDRRRRPARPHARARGLPAGHPLRHARSGPRTRPRRRSRRASSATTTTVRRSRVWPTAPTSSPYQFENVPVEAARFLDGAGAGVPAGRGARSRAGSDRGEGALRRRRDRRPHRSKRWRHRRSSATAMSTHRSAGGAEDAPAGLRRKGPGRDPRPAARRGRLARDRRAPARSSSASSRSIGSSRSWEFAAATARSPSTRWSRTTIGTASCACRSRRRPI